MSDETISVFLADDHELVREGLAALISKDDRLKLVGQSGSGLHIVDKLKDSEPDVAVIDITMPGLNGLDVCREVTRRFDDVAVLILTMHNDEEMIATALDNGASGYLMKESASEQFVEAINTVARGELYLAPGLPRTVLDRMGRNLNDPYQTLTSRERQVLQMIAEGQTNRQIAEKLHVAPKTVDTHRTHLMRKLNIHNQTNLVKYALRKKIIPLD